MKKLYLSHRLDILADCLARELFSENPFPLAPRFILVPNGALKQWLLLELVQLSAKRGVAGLKILSLEEMIAHLLPSPFQPVERVDLFLRIYQELSQINHLASTFHTNASQEEQSIAADLPQEFEKWGLGLTTYLNGSAKRMVELSDQLTHLFLKYGDYGDEILDEKKEHLIWQKKLFQQMFYNSHIQWPIQQFEKGAPQSKDPIHCFGFDFLSPRLWSFFNQLPAIAIYLFSPSAQYWDDLCTDQEKKRWNLYWKKMKTPETLRNEWQEYWEQAPSLLANWGKLGRETIKILDQFEWELIENYANNEKQTPSFLSQIQQELLDLSSERRGASSVEDSSIQIIQAGSSRLKEIEHLRKWILNQKVNPSDISVFAPDIDVYAPLIEYVFFDIPYKIFGASIESKSFFLQGLHQLIALQEGRWEVEELLALFSNPAFINKQHWDSKTVEQFQSWLSSSYSKEFKSPIDFGRLMDRFLSLRPEEKKPIEFSQGDLLETFIQKLLQLQISCPKEQTPLLWAEYLTHLVNEHLSHDPNDEADMAAFSFFQQLTNRLRSENSAMYPLQVIQHLLGKKIQGQIHPSYLNAVRFSSLTPGSITPNQVIVLIGMDEESFPRISIPSSLDLSKQGKQYIPHPADEDRYLFLQSLFSAQETFMISYLHLSPDEGKPIAPSLAVQELLKYLNNSVKPVTVEEKSTTTVSQKLAMRPLQKTNYLLWPETYKPELPEGEYAVSLSDLSLLVRHPWKFYLQKTLGIYLHLEFSDSFALTQAKLLRESINGWNCAFFESHRDLLSAGLWSEAIIQNTMEKIKTRDDQITDWGLKKEEFFSIQLRQSCEKPTWIPYAKTDSSTTTTPYSDHRVLEIPAYEVELTKKLQIQVVGEIKTVSEKGSIHFGDDHLVGLLKNWPEYLMTSLGIQQQNIFCIKTGQIRALEDPLTHLKQLLNYYFYALSAPSPLLNQWTDAILLKNVSDLEKKIGQLISGKGLPFEDPICKWVLNRIALPSSTKIWDLWAPLLQKTFSPIVQLYPTKRKIDAPI